MTRPADNTIAKKSGVVIPATAAATRETKAKGTATLASSDTQSGGFVILVLAFNWPTQRRAPWPLWAWGHVRRREHRHLDDCPLQFIDPGQHARRVPHLASLDRDVGAGEWHFSTYWWRVLADPRIKPLKSRFGLAPNNQAPPFACPLWVISRHRVTPASCPLYPQKRTFVSASGTSA